MQCQWIKGDGEQCKRRAIVGESYCSTHLRMAKAAGDEAIVSPPRSEKAEVIVAPTKKAVAIVPTNPSKKVEVAQMAVVHSNKPKSLRFTGKGTYSIPSKGVYFYERGQVLVVDHDTWARLLEDQPDAFEEA